MKCACTLLLIFFTTILAEKGLNLIPLKRAVSEVLKLKGVPFRGNINKIDFYNETWGELVLDKRLISMMTEIVNREIGLFKKTNGTSLDLNDAISIPFEKPNYGYTIVYSVSAISDVAKQNAIRNMFGYLNQTFFAQYCLHTPFYEGPMNHSLLVFKEDKRKSSEKFCAKIPFGLNLNGSTVVELSCFDNVTIAKSILYALGFASPLWRSDRDRFVNINWTNIEDKHKYLFHKWNFDGSHKFNSFFSQPFDYSSVMNYKRFQLDKNENWFAKKKKNEKVSVDIFSESDLKLIRSAVCAPQCPDGNCWVGFTICADDDTKCLFWKDKNKCSDENVKSKCPVACDVCPSDASFSKCDDSCRYCLDWKGECSKSSKHASYMQTNCKNTCGCPQLKGKGNWTSVSDTKEVCHDMKQGTIVSTENDCKKFCTARKLTHCFYLNIDGHCFGTTSCSVMKTEKDSYKRFHLE